MQRLKRHVPDCQLLRLIKRYLKAGVQIGKHKQATMEGVPQGGPLSPVLANVVLDELDWELERHGHRFARYADDCNIFVNSQRAGERVMASVGRFICRRLKLTVNAQKSAVDKPGNRKFLGFTVSGTRARIKVADQAIFKLNPLGRCHIVAHTGLLVRWQTVEHEMNRPLPDKFLMCRLTLRWFSKEYRRTEVKW
jgi:RNA-directed DNA polymerase